MQGSLFFGNQKDEIAKSKRLACLTNFEQLIFGSYLISAQYSYANWFWHYLS